MPQPQDDNAQGENNPTTTVVPVEIAGEQATCSLPQSRTVPETAATADLPVIPGFEIRGVLGRGGMGVVYLAWQFNLKRLVALKMILAGEHAGAEHLARFRAEAQAVAQLQHPNIVQVYEIGEQQGRSFVCLEYVDGGSLANALDRQPQPPMAAARMVEALARAMHYTHQRGIVHRDLKPANILLQAVASAQRPVAGDNAATESSRTTDHWAQATIPKITDFGLAKQLEDNSGHTVSGAVMGTPNYMAPEQALGKTRAIGPRTDVYALGVILYEMLTGRTPFRGETQMETLDLVVHAEPTPASQLQPGVPRDLETICLKAMAKEPEQRYLSALDLTHDLERFLAGEPILARREGALRRLWRKVRRHQATFAASLVLVLALIAGSFFTWEFSTVRQIRAVNNSISEGLSEREWTPAHLNKMEALVGELEQLSPEQAAEARRHLYQRYADVLIEGVRQKHDLDRIDKERVDVLQPRAKELADQVGREIFDVKVAVFDKELDGRLRDFDLTAAAMNDVQKLVAGIRPIDENRADHARRKLFKRFDERFRQKLLSDRALTRDDVASLEAALGLLRTSRPPAVDDLADLEPRLRSALKTRTGEMQIIRSLQPPFAEAGKVLKGKFEVVQGSGHLVSTAAPGPVPMVLLADKCQGNVQMEATFAYPSWTAAGLLGLSLNTSADGKMGYSFVLTVAPAVARLVKVDEEDRGEKRKLPVTLRESRTNRFMVMLQIRRNGVPLRQEQLQASKLTDKPLTMRAAREGSQLSLEILQGGRAVAAVRFPDLFAAGTAESGFFGLIWPQGVEMESVHLRRQTLPPLKGPLEEANHLFADLQVEKALELYQRAEKQAGDDREVSQEARFKRARCLAQLNDVNKAKDLLMSVMHEDKGKWPLIAACELWLILLREHKLDDADRLLLDLLAANYKNEQLAAVISIEQREAIGRFLLDEFATATFLLKPEGNEERLKSFERIHEPHECFSDVDRFQRFQFRWRLIRAYRASGKSARARDLLESWLRSDPPPAASDAVDHYRIRYLEEIGWIARELGQSHIPKALALIDQHIKSEAAQRRPWMRLLVEKARLQAVMGNWTQAEKELDAYFLAARDRKQEDYQAFSAAFLLKGFIHLRNGDEKRAQQAWTTKFTLPGSDQTYALTDPKIIAVGGIPLHQAMALASLTNQMTESEAGYFQGRLLVDLPLAYRAAINFLGIRFSPAMFCGMYATPRGREVARHIALQDLPLLEYSRLPAMAAGVSFIRREGFPASVKVGDDQETLLWNLCEETWRAMRSGKMKDANMRQLIWAWKGNNDELGWKGLSAALKDEPQLRGPLGYIMGQRLLRQNRPAAEAVEVFRAAAGDGAVVEGTAGLLLRRLAEAELERLKVRK